MLHRQRAAQLGRHLSVRVLIAILRRLRPEEGTLAIKKCLFDMPQEESGWYYGSDGVRTRCSGQCFST